MLGGGVRWSVALEWNPRDLWVGVYWSRRVVGRAASLHAWVCVVPCLPVHVHAFRIRPWRPKDGAVS
jgi:hypothetical protein